MNDNQPPALSVLRAREDGDDREEEDQNHFFKGDTTEGANFFCSYFFC